MNNMWDNFFMWMLNSFANAFTIKRKLGVWKHFHLKKEKENKHLPSTELQTGRMSVHLKALGHGWAAKTQLQEQERERERQGLSRQAKQLIIGSYYWGIVSARRRSGFRRFWRLWWYKTSLIIEILSVFIHLQSCLDSCWERLGSSTWEHPPWVSGSQCGILNSGHTHTTRLNSTQHSNLEDKP